MIPRYPIFKPLELSDATEVTVHTSRFAPYSDFNFVSLTSWNLRGGFSLSTLHGNLVVRFADYVTGAPFYSFIGHEKVAQTAEALLARAVSEGLAEKLRLIPEEVAFRLPGSSASWDPDFDSSDYILSARRLRGFDGASFRSKRHGSNRFLREHPHHRIERLDLANPSVQREVLDLHALWSEHKGEGPPYEQFEFGALRRMLELSEFLPELHATGIYVRDRLIAFMIFELVHRRHAMGHFWKANTADFEGVYPFLMRHTGTLLESLGYDHFNIEQDLGLPGLRQNKSSYAPLAFLRKYEVGRAHLTPIADVRASARPSRRPDSLNPFLLTGDATALGDQISLRAPAPRPDLFDLVRATDEEEPVIRNSGIRVVGDTPQRDDEESVG